MAFKKSLKHILHQLLNNYLIVSLLIYTECRKIRFVKIKIYVVMFSDLDVFPVFSHKKKEKNNLSSQSLFGFNLVFPWWINSTQGYRAFAVLFLPWCFLIFTKSKIKVFTFVWLDLKPQDFFAGYENYFSNTDNQGKIYNNSTWKWQTTYLLAELQATVIMNSFKSNFVYYLDR